MYVIIRYELEAESKTRLHAQTENESVAISASTIPDTAARIWQDEPFYCTVPQNDSSWWFIACKGQYFITETLIFIVTCLFFLSYIWVVWCVLSMCLRLCWPLSLFCFNAWVKKMTGKKDAKTNKWQCVFWLWNWTVGPDNADSTIRVTWPDFQVNRPTKHHRDIIIWGLVSVRTKSWLGSSSSAQNLPHKSRFSRGLVISAHSCKFIPVLRHSHKISQNSDQSWWENAARRHADEFTDGECTMSAAASSAQWCFGLTVTWRRCTHTPQMAFRVSQA